MTRDMLREEEARRRQAPLPFDAGEARVRLATFFGGRPEARVAFLFGSRASGRVRPSSDVDIAVWVDPGIPELQRALLGLEWMGRIPDALGYPGDVDLVILNDAAPDLAWDVVHAPVVLYEAEPDVASTVAARLRREYRDELPRLERRRKRLYDAIRRGDFRVRPQPH